MKTVKELIKEKRILKGHTQLSLSRLIGCTDQYICKLEQGVSLPSKRIAVRLAEELGIDPVEFLRMIEYEKTPEEIRARLNAKLPSVSLFGDANQEKIVLSPKERALIEIIRQLPEQKLEYVLSAVKLAADTLPKPKQKRIIPQLKVLEGGAKPE